MAFLVDAQDSAAGAPAQPPHPLAQFVERQRELVDACRGWARRMRHTKLPSGGVMSAAQNPASTVVCAGYFFAAKIWSARRWASSNAVLTSVLPVEAAVRSGPICLL